MFKKHVEAVAPKGSSGLGRNQPPYRKKDYKIREAWKHVSRFTEVQNSIQRDRSWKKRENKMSITEAHNQRYTRE